MFIFKTFSLRFSICAILLAFLLVFTGCLGGTGTPTDPGIGAPTDPVSPTGVVIPTGPTGVAITYPATINQANANNFYTYWINTYYQTSEQWTAQNPSQPATILNAGRIKWDAPNQDQTVSEAIGYGLLIALFQNDPEVFARLFNYYVANLNVRNLMDWKIEDFWQESSSGKNSATDADLDAATAMILAHKKGWGQHYLDRALVTMNAIKTHEINPANNLLIPGDMGWILNDNYNPGYISPVAFKLFAEYDPAWNAILEANMQWLRFTVMSQSSGLYPDWVNQAGVATRPFSGVGAGTYDKYSLESIRIPWRLAWYYAWYGDGRAHDMLNLLATTIRSRHLENPADIKGVYLMDGTPGPAPGTAGFVGGFCAAGMVNANHQAWVTNCYNHLVTLASPPVPYFPDILKMMYLQLLSGMYIKP
jgi:endo-1,4-beta-D-glucanase Y